MSIESFFTLQSLNTPHAGKGLGVANAQALSADSAQGVNFLDFILAKLNEAGENANGEAFAKANEHSALQSDNPALEKNPKLDLAAILADNPDIKEELQDFIAATGLGPDAALKQVLELNKQAFDDVLNPLTDGIITPEEVAEGSPRILQALLVEPDEDGNALLSKINEIKAKIKKLIESGDGEIVATNLTPEDLATLGALPEDIPGGFDFETALKEAGVPPALIEKLSFALIKFTVPQSDALEQSAELSDDPGVQTVLALFIQPADKQNNAHASHSTLSEEAGKEATDILAARLNALNPGSGDDSGSPIKDYTGNAETSQSTNKVGVHHSGHDATTVKPPAPSADLSAMQNFLFTPGALNASFSDILSQYEQSGLPSASSAPLSIGQLTSAVTQAQSAGAASPAVQMVAVNMQKAAGDGQNKTLSLQLDPPELGRVHVKMEFGHDKTVKAVVTAEKPETFLMLQRDSHTLERALSDAGLDTGGGLSFELAEQGFNFDGDNRRGGGHDQGGTGAGSADEPELIQSTMTWHVDAESGHTRYDILA